jgi:hypothetical protein
MTTFSSPIRLASRMATVLAAVVLLSPTPKARGQQGVVGGTIAVSGMQLEVRRKAFIPNYYGTRSRMNGMASTGIEGDTNLYVADQGHSRTIYRFDSTTTGGVATPFFDVQSAVVAATGRNVNVSNIVHGGVRSVAFHPEFATNGRFYTAMMEDRPADLTGHTYLSDSATPIQADSVVVEWTFDHTLGQVDTTSYREVFRVGMPVADHSIRQMAFNPHATVGDEDYGLLYVAHGDGSVQSATAGGGQNSDALGKMLRINPLQNGAASYSVPATNPFVDSVTMLPEVYTLGHRNPHNFSFAEDAFGTTHAIQVDIGRDNVDEVNLLVPGGNYGWSEREGTFVHLASGGIETGIAPLPADEALNGYVYPVAQYGHEGPIGAGFVGQALVGGYVARAGDLTGEYVFGEFGEVGRIFHVSFDTILEAVTTLDPLDPSRNEPGELTQAVIQELSILFDHDDDQLTPGIPMSFESILQSDPNYTGNRFDIRFGQGHDGTIYLMNKNNGWIYEAVGTTVVAVPEPGTFVLFGGSLAAAAMLRWRRNGNRSRL